MKVYGKEVPQEVIDAIETRMVGRFERWSVEQSAKYNGVYEYYFASKRIMASRARKNHIVYDKSTRTWSRTDLWE